MICLIIFSTEKWWGKQLKFRIDWITFSTFYRLKSRKQWKGVKLKIVIVSAIFQDGFLAITNKIENGEQNEKNR